MAALNFLLTSLSKLDEKRRELTECQERLHVYKLELSVCQARMQSWESIWHADHPFVEETYKYFWQGDYQEIRDNLKRMDILAQKIKHDIVGKNRNLPLEERQNKAQSDPARPQTINLSKRGHSFHKATGLEEQDLFPQEADWSMWESEINKLRGNSSTGLKIHDTGIIHRIAFALFKNQTLGERLGRFKQGITNIAELSSRQFDRLHGESTINEPTSDRVYEAIRLKDYVDQLTSFAKALFEQYSLQTNQIWALELRFPDNCGNLKDWDSTSSLDLDFTVSVEKNQKTINKRVRIRYTRGIPNQSGIAADVVKEIGEVLNELIARMSGETSEPAITQSKKPQISSSGQTKNLEIGDNEEQLREQEQEQERTQKLQQVRTQHVKINPTKYLSTKEREISLQLLPESTGKTFSFRKLFEDGFFEQEEVYKAWELDRADLTLGLVNWMILLWDTPWTTDPCCCGIRFEHVSPSAIHTFNMGEHKDCSHETWKLQHLGLVLAELTIATPIRVVPNSANFKYQQWNGSTDIAQWEDISREKILETIRKRSRSEAISNAVKFCLDTRSQLARGEFQAQFMLQFIQHIFNPVEEYCNVTLQARRRFMNKHWWRQYILGSPWPNRAYESWGDPVVPQVSMAGSWTS